MFGGETEDSVYKSFGEWNDKRYCYDYFNVSR